MWAKRGRYRAGPAFICRGRSSRFPIAAWSVKTAGRRISSPSIVRVEAVLGIAQSKRTNSAKICTLTGEPQILSGVIHHIPFALPPSSI